MAKPIPMVLHTGNVWIDPDTGKQVDAPSGQLHPADIDSKSIDVGSSASGFADDFPGKQALEEAQLTLASIKGLDKVALVQIKGIGDKTAEAILDAIAG